MDFRMHSMAWKVLCIKWWSPWNREDHIKKAVQWLICIFVCLSGSIWTQGSAGRSHASGGRTSICQISKCNCHCVEYLQNMISMGMAVWRTMNHKPVACSTAKGYTAYLWATGLSKLHVMVKDIAKHTKACPNCQKHVTQVTQHTFLTLSHLVAQLKAWWPLCMCT